MTTLPKADGNDDTLRVRRGRVESVDLYEIKDSELDLFEKGSPSDLQLNFAIFLLSLAFSAVVALSTATFANHTVQTAYLVVAVVGVLLGAYLLIAWRRNRTSAKHLCVSIRRRMKESVTFKTGDDSSLNEGPPPSQASEPKG